MCSCSIRTSRSNLRSEGLGSEPDAVGFTSVRHFRKAGSYLGKKITAGFGIRTEEQYLKMTQLPHVRAKLSFTWYPATMFGSKHKSIVGRERGEQSKDQASCKVFTVRPDHLSVKSNPHQMLLNPNQTVGQCAVREIFILWLRIDPG